MASGVNRSLGPVMLNDANPDADAFVPSNRILVSTQIPAAVWPTGSSAGFGCEAAVSVTVVSSSLAMSLATVCLHMIRNLETMHD